MEQTTKIIIRMESNLNFPIITHLEWSLLEDKACYGLHSYRCNLRRFCAISKSRILLDYSKFKEDNVQYQVTWTMPHYMTHCVCASLQCIAFNVLHSMYYTECLSNVILCLNVRLYFSICPKLIRTLSTKLVLSIDLLFANYLRPKLWLTRATTQKKKKFI